MFIFSKKLHKSKILVFLLHLDLFTSFKSFVMFEYFHNNIIKY